MEPHSLDTSITDAWRQLEELIEQLEVIARGEPAAESFHESVLQRALQGTGACGGVVWQLDSAAEIILVCHQQFDPSTADQMVPDGVSREQLLREAITTREPLVVSRQTEQQGTLTVHPMVVDSETEYVLELAHSRPLDAQQADVVVRFVSAIGEVMGRFHEQAGAKQTHDATRWWLALDHFSRNLYRQENLSRAAYTLVNEGRRLLHCDRVSLLVYHGEKLRVRAVSGVESLDLRSNLLRYMEQFASAIALPNETFWYPQDAGDLPDELEQLLDSLLDESHAKAMVVLPLFPVVSGEDSASTEQSPTAQRQNADHAPLGVLVAESFTIESSSLRREQVEAVGSHAALALDRLLWQEHVPFSRRLMAIGRSRFLGTSGSSRRVLVISAAILLVASLLAMIPVDFRIEARGVLLPQLRRNIFAPTDGEIIDVHVSEGEVVKQTAGLATMRNDNLEYELKRVEGSLETTESAIQATRSSRLKLDPDDRNSSTLGAEQVELQATLDSLIAQRRLLLDQKSKLSIEAPISGQVLTWNVADRLQARPVRRGDLLMSVADLHGPWILEVQIPDDRAGHVLRALQRTDTKLPVSFVLASDPTTTLHGQLLRVGMAVDSTTEYGLPGQGTNVRAIVEIESTGDPLGKPGASVSAKIVCNKRPLGYIWLHRIWESISYHVF